MLNFTAYASSSRGNFYAVRCGDSTLGIECGISIARMREALDFKVSELDAVLVTHHHLDHCRAVADVVRSGVDVWASRETFSAIGAGALDVHAHRLRELKARELTSIEGGLVLPFDVRHDADGALGFLVAHESSTDRLLFVVDTAFVPYRFEGLTHVAIECNYSRDLLLASSTAGVLQGRIIQHHLSLERLLGVLAANDLSRVREITLLHLSNAHSDAEHFRTVVAGATGVPTYIAGEER